ncbi:MAG TPA: PaaI family thioesterase [Gammaproteobacteria bacterium]|nr:PaaI family thioesterase [Xanthomonadales bacterium]MCB1595212.1 PaaI family thioesterase [Xanthomonadales bacterium]HOP22119.1 PaaI family thioesterase [Gammaproteobacteria bacterium]HPI94619.1 PaaI family thioesterase [Gammaproteobacteria bacterium]HPQ86064.1 PaaI family thioesterase [Gammaproteobacteria bacterium]
MNNIWYQEPPLASLNQYRASGLGEVLEIKIVGRGANWLLAEMPVKEKHKQPFGIVHGGATAALAETVASIAGWLCIDPKMKASVGLELNINHLKSVTQGTLFAKGTAVHVGGTTQVWQIDIFNSEFKQVSTSRLTVMVIDRK